MVHIILGTNDFLAPLIIMGNNCAVRTRTQLLCCIYIYWVVEQKTGNTSDMLHKDDKLSLAKQCFLLFHLKIELIEVFISSTTDTLFINYFK